MPKNMPKTNKYGIKWGSLYKPKNSRYWWVKYTNEAGAQCRESTKTIHLGKAKMILHLVEQRVKQSKKPQANTLESLLERYLVSLSDKSRSHRTNSKARLSKFFADQNIKSFIDICRPNIADFVDSLKLEYSASTVRGYVWTISSFCEFLIVREIMFENPCRGIKLPKIQETPPRYLDDAEYDKALEIAAKNGIYMEVMTALKTGMRSNEIRLMRWEHMIWNKNSKNLIVIPKAKGKRGRTIPMHPKLAVLYGPYKKNKGPVFPGERGEYRCRHIWGNLLKPLQDAIPKFRANHRGTGTGWHLLRHAFGHRMANAGTPLPKLKEIMGHKSIKTTMIYSRTSPDVWHDDILNA